MERSTATEIRHDHPAHRDITQQTVDAIVNARNSSLYGGGGVDELSIAPVDLRSFEECRKVRATKWQDGLPPEKLSLQRGSA